MKMKLISKAVITALIACGISMTGLSAANADFGGGTSGGGSGNTQPPVNNAPPATSGSGSTAYPNQTTIYSAGKFTWMCSETGPDVIGGYATYTRMYAAGTWQGGKAVPPPKGLVFDSSYQWDNAGYNDASGNPVFSRYEWTGSGCLYKPQWYAASGGICVKESTVVIDMIAPSTKNLASRSFTTPWGNGDKTIAGCDASRTASVAAGVTPKDLGHYHAYGKSTVDIMWVKRYVSADHFGNAVPDELLGYAPGTDQGVFDKYGTQTCSGWVDGLVPFSNYTPCAKPGGLIQCVVGGPIAADLRAPGESTEQMRKFGGNSFEFMRDGEPRRIDFTGGTGAPTVAGPGVSNVRDTHTRYLYENLPWSGKIWDNGKNFTEFKANGHNLINTYDYGTGKGSSYWNPGIHWNDAAVRFFDAGSSESTKITPEWNFTADFTTPGISIDSFDSSGNMTSHPVTFVQTGQANCTGNTLDAKVYRAIGDDIP